MPTLKQIVQEQNTPLGRAFDASINFLIIFSVMSFAPSVLRFAISVCRTPP